MTPEMIVGVLFARFVVLLVTRLRQQPEGNATREPLRGGTTSLTIRSRPSSRPSLDCTTRKAVECCALYSIHPWLRE